MKNVINYYYNLNPTDIHQVNKIYKFHISDENYIMYPCYRNIEEIKEIYDFHISLLRTGYYCHHIILNINNEITTIINGTHYILLKTFIENRTIKIQDIIFFNNIYIDNSKFVKIKRSSWHKLWMEKIDYIEYQISQFGKKYPIIRESSDYYIGIVENCISLLVNINDGQSIMTISHNRIGKEYMLLELYNPINFIIDHRIRDASEYFKYCILDSDVVNQIRDYIFSNNLTEYEINLFFIRILYPSYYFDMCEQIIDGKKEEKEMLNIINNVEIYENKIKEIYNYLRNIIKIPEIEWLIKK